MVIRLLIEKSYSFVARSRAEKARVKQLAVRGPRKLPTVFLSLPGLISI